ncbi:MAG: chemotaxis protein CheB [Desulfobacterales bacterium]|nr:chemotaxis protein CheB [Desulfobacterales bacterium]
MKYKAVVIGVSAGGMKALNTILPELPRHFSLPVIVVIHRHAESDDYLERSLNERCELPVKQADEKEKIQAGSVYFAPPNYHLLVEEDHTFSLSVDQVVNFARPSIDVLFESAAYCYGARVIGVILTGANSDGSQGLKTIKEMGGLAIVQTPESAEVNAMPKAAIAAARPDHILDLQKIGGLLIELARDPEAGRGGDGGRTPGRPRGVRLDERDGDE